MENLNQIFQRILDQTDAKSINGDNQYIGLCPAHDDDSPSFSIKMNDEKILMNCFAGCSFDQICSSLGIQKSETFNQSESPEKITHNEREIQPDTFIDLNKKVSFYSPKHKQKVFEKTRYPYRKSDGDIIYFVIRSEPKDFRCMNPMGELKIEGIERVPYRLPQMIRGIKDSKKILILEGEKDADRAAEMGFIATTFQGGAGKWKEEYLEHFVGAHVVLIPDNDKPGYEGMNSIAQKLIGTAIEVAILELPGLGERKEKHGKDFSNWADIDGNTSNALMDLIKKTDSWVTPLDDWLEPTERGYKVNRALLAQHMASNEDGNLIYVNQTFWQYGNGLWERLDDVQIKSRILNVISDRKEALGFLTSAMVDDIFKQLGLILIAPKGFSFNQNPMVLNFTNGVLDLDEGKFSDQHKRELFQNIQFTFDFDRDQKCPQWLEFLKSLNFDDETVVRLQEWVGYCLLPQVIGTLQKSLFFIGEGSNGKSVFLETIASVLDNVSHLELSELFDRFKIAEIEGKLANICTDVETSKVMDARFKKIVAGETQSAERKFKDPFEFQPFAKILFSANDFIPTKDRTHGFYRRFDIVRFSRIFGPEEQKPDLLQELKEELPGIFNWALEGLERLSKQEWKMTRSRFMESCHEEFRRATNPLQIFLEEECIVDRDTIIDAALLREAYKNFCDDRGYKILSDNNLGQELKRLGIERKRKRLDGIRGYVYEGVRLLSSGVPSCP
tara:strand:- start:491 stop:2677 length:2187 start_codon:yes stop_codon:yes gene_type:complete